MDASSISRRSNSLQGGLLLKLIWVSCLEFRGAL